MHGQVIEQPLLRHLVAELSQRSGNDFQDFVRYLLQRKFGPSSWPAQAGIDGGIDYVADDMLIQIYGTEKPRGTRVELDRKLRDVKSMKETARKAGIKYSQVVFITNFKPSPQMALAIKAARKRKITVLDANSTAELLYHAYYPIQEILNHNKAVVERFRNEDWPYDLDESQFVQAVEYSIGNFDERKPNRSETDCIDHLTKQARNRSVVLVGFYGMGKTTVLKMLFSKLSVDSGRAIPVFINMTHRNLQAMSRDGLVNLLAKEISATPAPADGPVLLDEQVLHASLRMMIQAKSLLPLFDGIDEAVHRDRQDLLEFLSHLRDSQMSFVLTSRLEFYSFLDIARALLRAQEYHVVELTDWGEDQWAAYTAAMHVKHKEKHDLVQQFRDRLKSRRYANLPARPLFLRMLADLEIHNASQIRIDPRLMGNLSEIYYKFVNWKLQDDYNRKGGVGKMDRTGFQGEGFRFVRDLATIEYRRLRQNQEGFISLDDVSATIRGGGYNVLEAKQVQDLLLHSSLFSIIRRTDGNRFTFSHKSFMEYLVANLYASTVFSEPGRPELASCELVWGEYQTYEVSQHFLQEIERIRISHDLNENQMGAHFGTAFNRVVALKKTQDNREFDEKLQSVLYYAGRLKIHSPEIIEMLRSIIKDRDSFHRLYYRTACISLSVLDSPIFAHSYVNQLLDDHVREGTDYQTNLETSKGYYGIPGIERVLLEDIEAFVDGRANSPILALKLLTYCAYIVEKDSNLKHEADALVKRVRQRAEGNASLERVCDRIRTELLGVSSQ